MEEVGVEPYVRCCDCQKIRSGKELKKLHGCLCGGRRFRQISYLSESEAEFLKEKDPVFFAKTFEVSSMGVNE